MKSSRYAFTLVELLVVIAIIGIMIGMMFPAVGAMQEAARRSTCQNRLAQLGIALQKYESGYGVLPPGTTEPKGPIHNVPQGIQLSWTVQLAALSRRGGHASSKSIWRPGHTPRRTPPVRSLRIAAFVCPSQRSGPQTAVPGEQLCRLPSRRRVADCRRQPRRAVPQQPHLGPRRDRRRPAHDLPGREADRAGRPGLDVRHAGHLAEHGHAARQDRRGETGRAICSSAVSAPIIRPGRTFSSATSPCGSSARRSTRRSTSNWAIAPTASS